MLKLTAVVSLMLIATWSQVDTKRMKKEAEASRDFGPGIETEEGSTLWAAGLSCDSCGSECAAACGTRHFRSCCFNYLRKKRGPEVVKFYGQNPHDTKSETQTSRRVPIFITENIPEPWMTNPMPSDFKPYPLDDSFENRLQIIYDV